MGRVVHNFRIIFAAGVAIAFAYGVYEACSYAYLAKIFPFYISLFLLVLAVVNLIQEIRKTAHAPASDNGGGADLTSQWDITMTDVWLKFLVYVGVICILYICIWIVGYPISLTLFIILFYRYVTATGWIGACIAGGFGLGFLALVSKLLYMDWPEGLIILPWPLG
jgi:hypothetical protein